MKAIVAATDLTARSDRAVARAGQLAAQFGAELLLLHVIDDGLPEAVAARRKREAERLMRTHLADLPKGLRGSAKVAFGGADEAIVHEAKAFGADLLVAGAHRKGVLRDAFLGSTADRALRAGRAPVLVAAHRPSGPYRRVVVAVDFSIHSRRAAELAALLVPEGEVRLVYAHFLVRSPFGSRDAEGGSRRELRDLQRDFAEEMDRMRPAAPPTLQIEAVVRAGDPGPVLRKEVERMEAELLVVGTHGRAGVGRALLGSVAEDLLSDPPCDTAGVRAW